ncbi:hypothetical protein [Sunxiuqinia rutila]|uniref:hypothetical protein n=1 Tax=Sunxiuqinia rutila TaxID=1397841 RepID=UPI003D36394F
MKQDRENQPLLFVSTTLLSLLGSGLGVLAFGFVALVFEPSKNWIISVTNSTSMDHFTPVYFVLLMAVSLLSLIGVIKIRKWQKAGFFFYLGAQLALLFMPVLWLGWSAFSVINLIFTSLFLLIYLSFYKHMS